MDDEKEVNRKLYPPGTLVEIKFVNKKSRLGVVVGVTPHSILVDVYHMMYVNHEGKCIYARTTHPEWYLRCQQR